MRQITDARQLGREFVIEKIDIIINQLNEINDINQKERDKYDRMIAELNAQILKENENVEKLLKNTRLLMDDIDMALQFEDCSSEAKFSFENQPTLQEMSSGATTNTAMLKEIASFDQFRYFSNERKKILLITNIIFKSSNWLIFSLKLVLSLIFAFFSGKLGSFLFPNYSEFAISIILGSPHS